MRLRRLRAALGHVDAWIDDATWASGADAPLLEVTGWCEHVGGAPATIELRLDGAVVGRAACRRPRPDAAGAVGADPSAPLGFRLNLRVEPSAVGRPTELGLHLLGRRRRGSLVRRVVPPVPSAAPHPLILGEVDHPADGERIRGPVVAVSGWALAAAGTARVEVEVDGTAPRPALLGIPRPDIDDVHPWTDVAGCGFSAVVDVSSAGPGKRTVVVRVVDGAGRRHELARRTAVLDPPTARPAPLPAQVRSSRRSDATVPGDRPRLLVALPDGHYGGAQLRTLELLPRLRERFAVVVLVPRDGELLPAFRAAGVRVVVLGGGDQATAARQVIEEGGIDVVLAETLLCDWAVRAATAVGVPSVFEVHESVPLPELLFSVRGGDEGLRDAARASQAALTEAAVVVVAQERLAADVERLAGRAAVVVPTGIDVTRWRDALKDGTPVSHRRPRGPHLLCVGTGAPHKGQAVLLRALLLLDRAQLPRVTMLGAGESSYVHALEQDIWAAGLDTVNLVPITPDPAPWFAEADLLICPSYTETFPGVMLEARVAGLPIVASDLPGTRAAAAGHNVTWVPAGDARAFADGVAARLAAGPADAVHGLASGPAVPDAADRADRLMELLATAASAR